MLCPDLHLDGFGLRITSFVPTPDLLVLALEATAAGAACPRCGGFSSRVHSHYVRTLADLPCQDRPVALRVTVRRFRCAALDCATTIFCERLPHFLSAPARTTARAADLHRAIGLALGGEAGARLADEMALPTSPDTILRRVKACADDALPPPRYVGVDDWAWRKGHTYGTIVIDLERGRVLDLLPGRDGGALEAWLKEHPGVEVITRDRWAAFAQAATAGAPQARQVADRWHLLKNLREAVERLLDHHAALIRESLQAAPDEASPPPATVPGPMEPASTPTPPRTPTPAETPTRTPTPAETPTSPRPVSRKEQARQAKQQARVAQYEQVHALRAKKWSIRQIAQAAGMSIKRVMRYLRADRCPERGPGQQKPTQLDRFATSITTWIQAGGRNAADLYRQLVGKGLTASYDAVRRYLARCLGSTGKPGPRVGPLSPPRPAVPSTRKLSFEFLRRPEKQKAAVQAQLDQVRGCTPALREGLELAEQFAAMVRQCSPQTLAAWLAQVEASSCAALRSFAAGLRQDAAAVSAALTEKWSNGPVEGQVNRLKMMKRQMYGRAGLDLLRARVCFAA